jgi:hypothetical protein
LGVRRMYETKENIWFLSLWIVLLVFREHSLATWSLRIAHWRTFYYLYLAPLFLLAHCRTSSLNWILFISVFLITDLFNALEVVESWSLLYWVLYCCYLLLCRNYSVFFIELFCLLHRVFSWRIRKPNLLLLWPWTLATFIFIYLLTPTVKYMKQSHFQSLSLRLISFKNNIIFSTGSLNNGLYSLKLLSLPCILYNVVVESFKKFIWNWLDLTIWFCISHLRNLCIWLLGLRWCRLFIR